MSEKNLKILVINVCLRPYRKGILYPLGLAYVVSAINRSGYQMEILDLDRNRMTDEEIDNYLSSHDFDIVAMGCIVTGYKIIKKLSAMIKKANKDAIIIVGNSVADSIPEILLKKTKADVAVIGEGDNAIIDILENLQRSKTVDSLAAVKGIWYKDSKGNLVANPHREPIRDIDSIPFPKWELFDMEGYMESAKDLMIEPFPLPREQVRAFMVNTARGCPFSCSFCYQVFRKSGYRHRSSASIIAEIKELQARFGINYVPFSDDLSFPNKNDIESFADSILADGLKFYWTASARSNLFNDRQDLTLLKKVKESGCLGFGYSLESANKEILKAMNKFLNKENFILQKRLLDEAGLMSWTSLVLGYPMETKETIKETMDLCYELDMYPSCGYLLPQPGTPMYEYIFKEGIVKDEEEYLIMLGDRQDLRINLTKIPSDELQQEVSKHLQRISDKLKLNYNKDKLIKTGKYRSVKSSK